MENSEKDAVEAKIRSLDDCTSLIQRTNDNLSEVLIGLSQLPLKTEEGTQISQDGVTSIVKGLESISHATSTVPDGSLTIALFSGALGALVASISAYLFNTYYLSRRNKNNRKSYYGTGSIKLLDEFEKCAVHYWLNDSNNLTPHELEALEVKIKNLFFVLQANLKLFNQALQSRDFQDRDVITSCIGESFDLSTGGDFEVAGRSKDVTRANQLSSTCARLKATLMRHSYHEA